MLKKILIALFTVIFILFLYATFQPSEYKIERSVEIWASAEVIFPHINNSKKANEWMPWLESDPGTQMTFLGPDEGVGSISSWQSNGQMGVGQAEVIESIPNKKVVTKISYQKPMEMIQESIITLVPQLDKKTIVTWSVHGTNNVMGRFFCIFVNMDKLVGSEFEKGLAKLKSTIEQ